MPGTKRLRSVCQSIVQHAVSGLSFLQPHVMRVCRSAGLRQISVDLLDPEPCPSRFRDNEPLRRSLSALKERFEGVLASEGFATSDLKGAYLTFQADPAMSDDSSCICTAVSMPRSGGRVESTVNGMGGTVDPSAYTRADGAEPRGPTV
jgi:hypothetical protein